MDKLKELIHYICHRCEDPTKLGAIKLNKVLWFSDVWAYMVFGSSITGDSYIKRQHGPVPKNVLSAIVELEQEQKMISRCANFHGYNKKEFFSLMRPDLSSFNANEISFVDEAIDFVCDGHTAKSISDKTHDEIWELAEIGEEIPLYTVFASRLGEINETDVAWAVQR